MALTNDQPDKRVKTKGTWMAEEDQKLAHCIEIHGAKRWKTIALKSGLNRCEKSCRLRWLNYLRPNIKRGNFSDAEDDMIIRLHKFLGNRKKMNEAMSKNSRKEISLSEEDHAKEVGNSDINFNVDEFFGFSTEGSDHLDRVNKFLGLEEDPCLLRRAEHE